MAVRSHTLRELTESPVLIDGDARPDDPDVEDAWNDFQSALRDSETPGIIRISQIPMREDGTPATNTKGQVQLGSYPVDQYNYDELLNLIRTKFMEPGETMFVRLTATEPGKQGNRFNRVITVKREKGASGGDTNFGEFAKILRETQEHNTALIRELSAPVQAQRAGMDWVGMFEKLGPIAAPIIAAWMGRPRGASSDLAGIVTVFKELQTMQPGAASQEPLDSTTEIIKSVAGPGLQFLTALAQGRQAAPLALPPPAAAPRQPLFPTQTPAAPAPPTQDVAAMMAQIKPYLVQLTELAADGADPAESAKLVLDMLPEELDDAIYQLAGSAASFARLRLICPPMGKHTPWFEAFRVALLAEMDKPDPTDAANNASATP